MARPAGQLERTTLHVRDGIVRGGYQKTLVRPVTGGIPNLKHALSWVADAVGAASLAGSIMGLSNTDTWNSTYRYNLELRNAQDNAILCTIHVRDADGHDLDDTKEYEFTRDGLKEALAEVAGQFGSATLKVEILAL
jgi:hypothetical protein